MHPDACLASTCVLSGGLRFARPVRPQRQMHRMQTNIFADVGEYSARRQLHAGIRLIPMRSILIELQAGDLLYSMADSSTTGRGFPIRLAGGYWARR